MTFDLFADSCLEDEKKRVMAEARNGCECPVCGQFVKIYRRKITSFMALKLIQGYKRYGHEWFHITSLPGAVNGGGDFAKLRFLGFLEEKPHVKGDEGKRSSGMWRITEKGVEYIYKRVTANKYFLMFDGKILGSEGGQVSIKDSLNTKFDYNELMKGL